MAFPILREIVTSLPEFSIEKHGVSKDCMLGNHAKSSFPISEHGSKDILDLVIEDEEPKAPKVDPISQVIFSSVQYP
jgi:hypothetical protein